MESSTFFVAFLLTFLVCVIITVILILLINKGLNQFFSNVAKESDIARFFAKLTKIIIILAGVGKALAVGYNTGKEANWLTLTWDISRQLEESLSQLFVTFMILAVAFFLLHLLAAWMTMQELKNIPDELNRRNHPETKRMFQIMKLHEALERRVSCRKVSGDCR